MAGYPEAHPDAIVSDPAEMDKIYWNDLHYLKEKVLILKASDMMNLPDRQFRRCLEVVVSHLVARCCHEQEMPSIVLS